MCTSQEAVFVTSHLEWIHVESLQLRVWLRLVKLYSFGFLEALGEILQRSAYFRLTIPAEWIIHIVRLNVLVYVQICKWIIKFVMYTVQKYYMRAFQAFTQDDYL